MPLACSRAKYPNYTHKPWVQRAFSLTKRLNSSFVRTARLVLFLTIWLTPRRPSLDSLENGIVNSNSSFPDIFLVPFVGALLTSRRLHSRRFPLQDLNRTCSPPRDYHKRPDGQPLLPPSFRAQFISRCFSPPPPSSSATRQTEVTRRFLPICLWHANNTERRRHRRRRFFFSWKSTFTTFRCKNHLLEGAVMQLEMCCSSHLSSKHRRAVIIISSSSPAAVASRSIGGVCDTSATRER